MSILRLDNLLQPLQKDIRVLPLENQHRPQTHSSRARATDIDTNTFGLLQHLIPTRAVPRDESALALATEIKDLFGVALGQALEAGEEIFAGFSGVLDEVLALDFVDDGAEEDGAGGVAEPAEECVSISG